MPRCKPKRFHRNRNYRVARRKKKRRELINGTSRNSRRSRSRPKDEKKRPKNKKEIKNE